MENADEIIKLKKLHIELTELERLSLRQLEIEKQLDEIKSQIGECILPEYSPPAPAFDPEPSAPKTKRGFNRSFFEWFTFLFFSVIILAGTAGVVYFAFIAQETPDFLDFIKGNEYYILGGLAGLTVFLISVRLIKHHLRSSKIDKNHNRLVARYRDYVKRSSGETLEMYEDGYKKQCQDIKEAYNLRTAEYLNASDELNAELNRILDKKKPLETSVENCTLFSARFKNPEDTAGILSIFEDRRADTLKEAINLYVAEKRDAEHRRLMLEEQIRLSQAMQRTAAEKDKEQ